ncbi:MAG TPA: hypothetical protein VGN72_10800 [Tepidisphaeraceae bacterium]|nr:hypothetical protein [Tepidisphaeraceae bacterium]
MQSYNHTKFGFLGVVLATSVAGNALGADAPPIADALRPLNIEEVSSPGEMRSGYAWQKVFWENYDPKALADAKRRNLGKRGETPYVDAGLMQWVGAFYGQAQKEAAAKPDDWAADFVKWIDARPHYQARRANGELVARGWVSPAMPLDEQDWPEGVKNATFADWSAARLTDFSSRGGFNAFSLADGWNGIPNGDAFVADFNPRVVAAFAEKNGLSIPTGSVEEQAAYIRQHHMTLWVDYMANSWATWMQRMIDLHAQKTDGEQLLFIFQTAHNAIAADRSRGMDLRLLTEKIGQAHILPRIELQAEPERGLKDISIATPRMALFAAREPDLLAGVQISSPERDPNPVTYHKGEKMSTAIDKRSGLTFASDEERSEFMYKFTKQHWLGVMWAHVATRDGDVRRAAASWHGNHGNKGRAPKNVNDLVMARVPSAPFGPAVYWSVAIEKALEEDAKTSRFDFDIQKFADRGYTPAFGVSDVALDNMKVAPSAFISSHLDLIPAEERKQIEAIAPLLDYEKADRVPMPMRVEGATGFGFVDQNGKTILVVARPQSQWKDRVSGDITIQFEGVADGNYTARELIDGNETLSFVVSNGRGSVTLPLEHWDSRVFETDLPAPTAR